KDSAVIVDIAQISGDKPYVLGERTGISRTVNVSGTDVRSPQTQDAFFARCTKVLRSGGLGFAEWESAHFGIRKRQPDRTGRSLERSGLNGHDSRTCSHAKDISHRHAGACFEMTGNFGWQRGTSRRSEST